MRYTSLGQTDTRVSLICLGTMTWGNQNSEAEAHDQLDFATGRGVNFIDTAEMYPVPPNRSTVFETERIIGNWLRRRPDRDQLVIATKAVGRSPMDWLRPDGETPRANRDQLRYAVEGSLRRLQTEVIDLYQLHWPDRPANYFGKLGYAYRADDEATPIHRTLEALSELVDEGRVRHIGISNETAWGTMTWLRLAREHGLARVVSIQNPYSLLNRSFEVGLAEIAHEEQVGLLAYSPLGFGMLTGKYARGEQPPGARLTLFPEYQRYRGDRAVQASEAYCALATRHGLIPAQMALAWVNRRSFLTSTIIGATTLAQLEQNIDSIHVDLEPDVLAGIEEIHERYTYPAP